MRFSSLSNVAAFLPFFLTLLSTTKAANIVISNDDGWAEINIRTFFYALTAAGNRALISAPAENQSGRGSLDGPPGNRDSPCEFDSCPAGSPPTGNNATVPSFNYVNSFPVTAMKFGIQTLAPQLLGGPPDIAVAGPNVGVNLGPLFVQFSGTVGAANEAAIEGIPGIAFSGTSGDPVAWNVLPVPNYSLVYADLATNLTNTLIATGKPYLPDKVWLNVNFPASSDTACASVTDFKFVLSRISGAIPVITPDDVVTCNNDGRLPTETKVTETAGCYVSVSVGKAPLKVDAGATEQAVVLQKLGALLSCLP